ncbi:hypothetical protein [Paracoccus sp. (in: a-proteobacteria)]|uniref:hypothetical protein n=1 Tax=Paracoccus sp. TaxID=267 RepID=UPI0026DFBBAA|nr:hypothetical protein [Paracoccus sp. (in: a-proteobacteria)]MDO5646442.1 hypothetical protein [Paracoccus sp. (in: a-proteobacteria)]
MRGAALILALLPWPIWAGPADQALAAHDRCLAQMATAPDEPQPCDLLLMWCDDAPDPDACRVGYATGIAARLADVTAQARAGGMDAALMDHLLTMTVDDEDIPCDALFSADDCATRNQSRHLAMLTYAGAVEGVPIRLPVLADVPDDLDRPVRDFDRCLDDTEQMMCAQPQPFQHPRGAICAQFAPLDCRWMADPAACRDHMRANLTARPHGTEPRAVTVFSHLPQDDLRDLALCVAGQRLSPLITPHTGATETQAPRTTL